MATGGGNEDSPGSDDISEEEKAWTGEFAQKLMESVRAAAATNNPASDLQCVEADLEAAMHTGVRNLLLRAKKYGKAYAEQFNPEEDNHASDAGEKPRKTEECIQFYFDERMKAEKPCSPSPPPEMEDMPQAVHRVALDKCLPELVRDMRANETGLLDKLVSKDVISERRANSIKGLKTSDLNRHLVHHVQSLSYKRFVEVFISAMKEEGGNALLAQKLESTIVQLQEQTQSEGGGGCKTCPLRNLVDLRRLADELRSHQLIDHDLYEDLRQEKLENREAWRRVLERVGHTQKMRPVLQRKYPDVWKEMGQRVITSLECKCLGFGFCCPGQKSSYHSTDLSSRSLSKEMADLQMTPITEEIPDLQMTPITEEIPDLSLMNNAADAEEGMESVGSLRGSSLHGMEED